MAGVRGHRCAVIASEQSERGNPANGDAALARQITSSFWIAAALRASR
jgi:hypothetical protein